MEGRKTKFAILKEILHYTFLAVMVALTIVSYLYKEDIANYFATDLTTSNFVNHILHYTPTVIVSIQVIVVAVVVNIIVKLLTKLSLGFTDKGKTLANVIASLLKWIIIIAAVLIILSVWGVDTTALVTGAGILALVVGLGAQSLIADILAGIFMVLEGEYVVGDIVIIDNWRGKIVSIGIRTTQLEDVGGNIRIINNSEIRSVTNQTKHQSLANCSVSVSSSENLENIENLIKEALPEVKQKIPAITEDIVYKGVSNITEISIWLLFTAKCYEEDLYQVQRDLNRELKLVLDRNNIPSFATPAINVGQQKNEPAKKEPKAKKVNNSVKANKNFNVNPQVDADADLNAILDAHDDIK